MVPIPYFRKRELKWKLNVSVHVFSWTLYLSDPEKAKRAWRWLKHLFADGVTVFTCLWVSHEMCLCRDCAVINMGAAGPGLAVWEDCCFYRPPNPPTERCQWWWIMRQKLPECRREFSPTANSGPAGCAPLALLIACSLSSTHCRSNLHTYTRKHTLTHIHTHTQVHAHTQTPTHETYTYTHAYRHTYCKYAHT